MPKEARFYVMWYSDSWMSNQNSRSREEGLWCLTGERAKGRSCEFYGFEKVSKLDRSWAAMRMVRSIMGKAETG